MLVTRHGASAREWCVRAVQCERTGGLAVLLTSAHVMNGRRDVWASSGGARDMAARQTSQGDAQLRAARRGAGGLETVRAGRARRGATGLGVVMATTRWRAGRGARGRR